MVFDIFKESIISAANLFKRKFEKFISNLTDEEDEDFQKSVFRIITHLTGMISKLSDSTEERELSKEFNEKSYETKLLAINVSVIEMLLPHINAGSSMCAQV